MSTPIQISSAGASVDAGDAVHNGRGARPIEGLGRAGLTIVAVASLILSLNQTSQSMVALPIADWLLRFGDALATNAVIGVAILLAAVWARHRHPEPGPSQYATASVAVTLAAFLAWIVLVLWDSGGTLDREQEGWSLAGEMVQIAANLVRYAVVGIAITGAWLYTCTEGDHAAAIAQCAVDSARMDEQTAEARLQMLEAQIEPHFLFNTLAHVRRLYATDRVAGARMLGNLKTYLAVALPQLRATDSTLGRELDHAKAYLEIQQIRMGRRLAYAIEVADALRGARLPPLMLLTLVENAIKHGLTPVPAGGRIDIRARVDAGGLWVEVADTGGGFTRSGGGGAGLANIRARLAAQFGTEASLSLALNSPCGVVATISLPYMPVAARARPS
ncbi:MAG: histidine kinase [Betaproteobacteria bacterium]|nr:histidine kinase [Betaproteobacteria bacterium]MDE2208730.1 histidine kinase [Betaproteobacteria bacterium]